MRQVKMTPKEERIFSTKINELKVRCKKCGHKEIFTSGKERKICSYCGNYIFKNEQAEFKYKMKGIMKHEAKRV